MNNYQKSVHNLLDKFILQKKAPSYVYVILRVLLYGVLLTGCETTFYSTVKFARQIPGIGMLFNFEWLVDPLLSLNGIWSSPTNALFGQASMYMIPVYGTISVFCCEPILLKLKKYPWFIRGVCYSIGIMTFECAWGWFLYGITGYKIWYYADVWSIGTFTSAAIGGLWFIIPLITEPFMYSMLYLFSKHSEQELVMGVFEKQLYTDGLEDDELDNAVEPLPILLKNKSSEHTSQKPLIANTAKKEKPSKSKSLAA